MGWVIRVVKEAHILLRVNPAWLQVEQADILPEFRYTSSCGVLSVSRNTAQRWEKLREYMEDTPEDLISYECQY